MCRNWALVAPLVLFVLSFGMHYLLIMGYQETLFEFHEEGVRQEILDSEKEVFKWQILGSALTLALQLTGTLLAMNIGLLFFDHVFRFKDLLGAVVKSATVLVFPYLLFPITMALAGKVYTFNTLYEQERVFSLLRYLNHDIPVWLQNLLGSISLFQLAFVLALSFAIKRMMDWGLAKGLVCVLRSYGTGFALWQVFALFMDINFYE